MMPIPDISSALAGRVSISTPPEPMASPIDSYLSARTKAKIQGGRFDPGDDGILPEIHDPISARGLGLADTENLFTSPTDVAGQEIQELRSRTLSLRSQIRGLRAKLLEKQTAKYRADIFLFQAIRSRQFLGLDIKTDSAVSDANTLENLIQYRQDTVYECNAVEDDYSQLEDELGEVEFSLLVAEEKFYNGLEEKIYHESEGALHVSADFEYHPLVLGFFSRLGDLDLLEERLDDYIQEKEALESQRDSHWGVRPVLSSEEQEKFYNYQIEVDKLAEEIKSLKNDVETMRQDCFSRGLIDENDEPIEPYLTGRDEDSTTCNSCGIKNLTGYYRCNTCCGDGYNTCFACTDKGLSCPFQGHYLMKCVFSTRTCNFVNQGLYTFARGLRVIVKGQMTSGIGDTGSQITIISEERCRELGESVIPDPTWITLGNQRRMFSEGTVYVPVAFPDTPDEIIMVLARVVKTFSFDILLGSPFLEATQTMEKHIHRFVRCLFSTKNLWSFYRVGETCRRFKAVMRDDITFEALADTGSRRNVMRADWALKQGFVIRSHPENLGWITFPTGPEEATIGQVHTYISLPGGRLVPTVFDILPTCRLPVVLGIDFVLDNNIYQNYADSFFDLQTEGSEEELHCMGMGRIPWYVKVGDSIKNVVHKISKRPASPNSDQVDTNNPDQEPISPSHSYSDTAELKRQLAWDKKYEGGKASVEEWTAETQRRKAHEEKFYPGHSANPLISLVSPTKRPPNPYSARSPSDTPNIRDNGAVGAGITANDATSNAFLHAAQFGQLEAAQWQT